MKQTSLFEFFPKMNEQKKTEVMMEFEPSPIQPQIKRSNKYLTASLCNGIAGLNQITTMSSILQTISETQLRLSPGILLPSEIQKHFVNYFIYLPKNLLENFEDAVEDEQFQFSSNYTNSSKRKLKSNKADVMPTTFAEKDVEWTSKKIKTLNMVYNFLVSNSNYAFEAEDLEIHLIDYYTMFAAMKSSNYSPASYFLLKYYSNLFLQQIIQCNFQTKYCRTESLFLKIFYKHDPKLFCVLIFEQIINLLEPHFSSTFYVPIEFYFDYLVILLMSNPSDRLFQVFALGIEKIPSDLIYIKFFDQFLEYVLHKSSEYFHLLPNEPKTTNPLFLAPLFQCCGNTAEYSVHSYKNIATCVIIYYALVALQQFPIKNEITSLRIFRFFKPNEINTVWNNVDEPYFIMLKEKMKIADKSFWSYK